MLGICSFSFASNGDPINNPSKPISKSPVKLRVDSKTNKLICDVCTQTYLEQHVAACLGILTTDLTYVSNTVFHITDASLVGYWVADLSQDCCTDLCASCCRKLIWKRDGHTVCEIEVDCEL